MHIVLVLYGTHAFRIVRCIVFRWNPSMKSLVWFWPEWGPKMEECGNNIPDELWSSNMFFILQFGNWNWVLFSISLFPVTVCYNPYSETDWNYFLRDKLWSVKEFPIRRNFIFQIVGTLIIFRLVSSVCPFHTRLIFYYGSQEQYLARNTYCNESYSTKRCFQKNPTLVKLLIRAKRQKNPSVVFTVELFFKSTFCAIQSDL